MEESGYLANILRGRECPLCGTDRQRVVAPQVATCAVCHAFLPADDVLFAVSGRACQAACSVPCLEVLLQEGLADGSSCPMCGSAWVAHGAARSCGTCAKALPAEGGHAALWRGGRIHAFCGPDCLETYLRRANRFCG